MPWRQLHARGRQEVDERIRRGRHRDMDRVEHLLVLLRSGDGQNLGMRAGDVVGLRAQTARDDDPPVLRQRIADGLEAFGLGAVEKPAGVHDDRVRARVIRRDRVALCPEAGQDALAVHERLGTAEADHADPGLARARVFGEAGARREVGTKVWRVLCHGRRHSASGVVWKATASRATAIRRPSVAAGSPFGCTGRQSVAKCGKNGTGRARGRGRHALDHQDSGFHRRHRRLGTRRACRRADGTSRRACGRPAERCDRPRRHHGRRASADPVPQPRHPGWRCEHRQSRLGGSGAAPVGGAVGCQRRMGAASARRDSPRPGRVRGPPDHAGARRRRKGQLGFRGRRGARGVRRRRAARGVRPGARAVPDRFRPRGHLGWGVALDRRGGTADRHGHGTRCCAVAPLRHLPRHAGGFGRSGRAQAGGRAGRRRCRAASGRTGAAHHGGAVMGWWTGLLRGTPVADAGARRDLRR